MESIQFETVLGADRVIHAPAGVTLPEGVIEVTIRPLQTPAVTDSSPPTSSRNWILQCAAEAEQSASGMPSDMAEHHDHYAYGTIH
jgi:hypothetical protein